MNTFVLLYKGGKAGSTPAEAEKIMKVWMGWFEKLGKTIVDPGKPFGQGKVVTSSGIRDGANASNGYTIIQADNLSAAAAVAKGCPIIADGGEVQVFETMAM
jgi:putative intracellular protease/amidase